MVNNRDWTLGENKAKQSQFKATQSQSRLAPSTAVGLKKQSEFATLPAKGAEKALPKAHIKVKQRISEKSCRKAVKLCSD